MTLRRFQKEGRLGCPSCYEAFATELDSLLRSIHDATQHCGRVPRAGLGACGGTGMVRGLAREIGQVEAQLKAAVAREAYEEAAKLRDALQQLKEKRVAMNEACS